jgi:hypothetical protein
MRIFTTCLLAGALALSACDREPRRTSAAPEATVEDRDRYEDYVEGRLREFELRFDGLEARMDGLIEADQDHLRVDIAELRDRKDALERKHDDLESVSMDSWLDVKASLDRGLDQLELAYNVVAANNHGSGHAPLEFDD